MFWRSKSDDEAKPVGGLVFFTSLLFLIVVALVNVSFLLTNLLTGGFRNLACFGFGFIPGFLFASRVVRGHMATFIHELKHSILANLAGNRAKGMVVRGTHGHFEYEYTQDTAAYNAFISLAPYWLPIFLIVTWPLTLLFIGDQHELAVALVGIAYGLDCSFSVRDISPHQSDFRLIRGGFAVGLVYVTAMNVVVFSFLITWVLSSLAGLQALALFWWQLGLLLVTHFRAA